MGGLGQGLQQAGQFYTQQTNLNQQREMEMQNRALQAALQREQMAQTKAYQDAALARQTAGDVDEQMRWQIGNTPDGATLAPADAQARIKAGYGSFVNTVPQGTVESRVSPNAGGFGVPALPQGAPEGQLPPTPSDTYTAVPTQDSKMRTAQINQAGATERAMQRAAVQQQIAMAKNQLDARELEIRADTNEIRRTQGLQDLQNDRWRLSMAAQALQFNMDRTVVDQGLRADANDIRAYSAQYGSGQQGGGADFGAALAAMIQGAQGGAGASPLVVPPPTAPVAKPAVPRPSRTTVPTAYGDRGKTGTGANTGRKIPPPTGKNKP